MSEPDALMAAARSILAGAERDAARGFHMSACAGAQRAAVMATEAWLRADGQTIVSSSVHENLCLAPDSGAELREAGRLLDRMRIEESPHGSASAIADTAPEAAAAVAAGRLVVDFAARRMGAVGPTGPEPTTVFGRLAGDYARFRPGYPEELYDALVTRLGELAGPVLDVASGTGAAVGPLLERFRHVVAIEPNPAMLARARSRHGSRPGWLGAVVARAEALPIASGAAACVTVAQAFHWLDGRVALDEFARALAPGGVLALVWNVTVADAFTDDVRDLISRHNPGYGRPVTRSMLGTPPALAAHPAFVADPPAVFAHGRSMSEDAYVGYAFSWSYCGGALSHEGRAPFERELRAVIRRHHPSGEWEERLTAVAHFARRLAPP